MRQTKFIWSHSFLLGLHVLVRKEEEEEEEEEEKVGEDQNQVWNQVYFDV